MIDGRQIRAARAMLGWSRDDLLKAAGISMSALLRLERSLADSRGSTINKVASALRQAGIEFLAREDRAIGVLLRPHDGRQAEVWEPVSRPQGAVLAEARKTP